MNASFWRGVFTLAGTTIGAGIFGIPYVTSLVGYPVGLLWLIVLTLVVIGINCAYAFVVNKVAAEGYMQLPGYGEHFLGRLGKYFGFAILVIGQWTALLAYVIGIGNFLAVVFNRADLEMYFSIGSFLLGCLVLLVGMKIISLLEAWLTLAMLLIVIGLFVFGLPHVLPINFVMIPGDGWLRTLAPYGVIFGALSGWAVIPEMGRLLKVRGHTFRTYLIAVLLGTLIPALVYAVFQFTVVGISGAKTSEDAITGLVPYLNLGIIKVGAIFGILAMFTSFITLAQVLKDTFRLDFLLPKWVSFVGAVLPPLIIFLAGFTSFILVLEVFGAYLGTTSALFVFVLYWRARTVRSE